MNFKLKTKPVKYPVELAGAKDHLRIELDFTDDDSYIKDLIKVATQTAEQFLHRRLITQTWNLYLQKWWCLNLTIPFGKLQSVTSIKYKDQDGAQSTWAAENYVVNTDSDPGSIVLGYNKCFPSDQLFVVNPIDIEFVCGYGLSGADVEDNIKHAIKIGLSDLYENHEDKVIIGGTASLLELGTFTNLLTPFKIDWF